MLVQTTRGESTSDLAQNLDQERQSLQREEDLTLDYRLRVERCHMLNRDHDLARIVEQRCHCIESKLRELSADSPLIISRLNQIAAIRKDASRDANRADKDSQQLLKELLLGVDQKYGDAYLSCLDPTPAIERAAYHEAGHVVVAARLGVKIDRGVGMCIDACEKGYSAIRLRSAEDSLDFPISRDDSILVLLAGGVAETRFDPMSTGNSSSDDSERIKELQAQEPPITDLSGLQDQSRTLVYGGWLPIVRLAMELLSKSFVKRRENQMQSKSRVARYLNGEEIAKILKPFHIEVRLTGFCSDE
jgi:hypothetical protein